MKQKDIFLIVVVVIVSGAVSLVLSNLLFGNTKKHPMKAEIVQPITADFNQPDVHYFNTNSIDPTLNITIGGTQNQQPFSSGSSQ
jgi:hypothetical protein